MGKRGGTGEESSTAEPAWANGTRTRSAVFLRPGVAGASARGRFELRFSTGGPWGFGGVGGVSETAAGEQGGYTGGRGGEEKAGG